MKHFFLLIITCFFSTIIFAQSPQAISYQAIARNATGTELISQPVGIKISVHTGTATGTIEYLETHIDTTNQFGLFTLQIGSGIPFVGNFAAIDWANGPKFLQVELDPTGGSTYTDMGTSQLLSVPYALYAASGGTPYTAGTGIGITGNVINNTSPDQTVSLTGIGQTSISGAYPNFTITTPPYTAGTGISIAGNVVSNTAPNQIVSVTGAGGTTVTGSYPNFTVSTPGSASGIGMQVFSTVGTSSFTIPAGVTKIIVEVWGGGGDGGSGGGGGGGGGGYGKDIFNVIPGTIYNVTVGGASGTSSFGALISATGGNSGSGCCIGGEGGTSTATFNISGGSGEQYANAGFGFGGSAGHGGIGGKRLYNINLNAGQSGGAPGGGGGEGTPGGSGGIGRVVVSW